MFEKEAKEYAEDMAKYYASTHEDYIPSQFEKYLRKAVEYGYNKAMEWHDLGKNSDDLPTTEGTFLLITEKLGWTLGEYEIVEGFGTWYDDTGSCEPLEDNDKVLKWKEIE